MRLLIRCTISLCIATLLCSAAASDLFAVETYDSCNCNNVTARNNKTVCIAGTNYSVNIDFCETVSNTYPYLTPICANSGGQNRISTIKKVCFNGARPTGLTNAQIISYILCDIKNTGCDTPNQWGILVPNNDAFCWTIQTPRCTRTDADNCIVACGTTCYKCQILLRWARVGGTCNWSLIAGAVCHNSSVDTCPEECEEGCPDLDTCCE